MQPFSHYWDSVTTSQTLGNAKVTDNDASKSLANEDFGDSLPVLPTLPLEKQPLYCTEAQIDAVVDKENIGDISRKNEIENGNASKGLADKLSSESSIVTSTDLQQWLGRLNQCTDKKQVFSFLDEFRPLPWSDDQRAAMSQAYHRLLDQF